MYYQQEESDKLTLNLSEEFEELNFDEFDRCGCGGRFIPIITECDYKDSISDDIIIGKSFPTELKLTWICELCGKRDM